MRSWRFESEMPRLFQAEAAREIIRTKDALNYHFFVEAAPEEYE
jgi:hypothetical protein